MPDVFGEAVSRSYEPRWVSVFTVDPGGTSGWAWLLFERRLLASDGAVGAVHVARSLSSPWFLTGEVDCSNEVEGTSRLVDWISASSARAARLVRAEVRVVVVLESFTVRERTQGSSLLSPERIGFGIKLLLEERGIDAGVFMQTPADAKNVVTDERLHRWDLWISGSTHQRDAVRHLILWLRKELNGDHT